MLELLEPTVLAVLGGAADRRQLRARAPWGGDADRHATSGVRSSEARERTGEIDPTATQAAP